MFEYSLVHGSTKFLLFKSQLEFGTDDHCLLHYEKGLDKGIFKFDHAGINQVWSELGHWGLVGRTCPVDLVRVLCASGCTIICSLESHKVKQLRVSYSLVNFYTNLSQSEYEIIKPILEISLGSNLDEKICPFVKLEDRLAFGSFYADHKNDPDVQFPKYCHQLEKDLCLPNGSIQTVLTRLFYFGFKMKASNEKGELVLAEYNPQTKIIRGYGSESTLFFVSKSKPVN